METKEKTVNDELKNATRCPCCGQIVKEKAGKNQHEIIEIICHYFDVPIKKVESSTRKRDVVLCRDFCMTFLKKYTDLSLKSIGSLFDRDHTTVISANQSMSCWLATEELTRTQYREIDEIIKSL